MAGPETTTSTSRRESEAAGAALVIEGLTKRYGDREAVSGVSLAVRAGSIHGLVGPNGSGKTTLLRSVLGLVRPDAGAIRVLGDHRAAAAARPRGGLAGLADDPRFYPYLSARENLRLLARLDGGRDADPAAALERVGLAEVAGRRVGGFSLGMRQRLGLAAALMRRPRVLLLDEPANGLDPAGADELWRMVRTLAGEGTAVLLSSHDLVAIDDVCDEITVLRAGEVAWSGPIADLRAQAPAPEHVLRTADDESAAGVAAALAVPVVREPDGLRVVAETDTLERLTVALGRDGVGIRSIAPGASPLRVLFARLTEVPAGLARPPRAAAAGPVPVPERGPRMAPGDVLAVCAVEARKLRAQLKLKAMVAGCIVAPWLFALAVKSADSLPADTLYGRWMLEAGAALPLLVLTFLASWAFPLLGSLVAGDILSSEDRLGTWPTLLTRSRPESAILAGKIVVSVVATVVIVALLAVSSSLAGLAIAGEGDLPGLTGTPFSNGHAFRLVAASWAAALPAALAWTAFALFLSARTRNSVAGIAVPVLAGVLLQIFWLVDGPPLIRELLPSAALDAWHGLFESPSHVAPLVTAVLVALGWTAVAVLALAVTIRRRDPVAA
jgi:ABC-2 type transport system ATP-binding protein